MVRKVRNLTRRNTRRNTRKTRRNTRKTRRNTRNTRKTRRNTRRMRGGSYSKDWGFVKGVREALERVGPPYRRAMEACQGYKDKMRDDVAELQESDGVPEGWLLPLPQHLPYHLQLALQQRGVPRWEGHNMVLNNLDELTWILLMLEESVFTFKRETYHIQQKSELVWRREMVDKERKKFIDDANMVAEMKTKEAIYLGKRRDGSLMGKVVDELNKVVSFYDKAIEFHWGDSRPSSATSLMEMVKIPRQALTLLAQGHTLDRLHTPPGF